MDRSYGVRVKKMLTTGSSAQAAGYPIYMKYLAGDSCLHLLQ